MKRKICVITGTRAEWGILSPVIDAIQKSKNLGLYLVATAMHLMKDFGLTVKEIESVGFKNLEKIDISYQKDTGFEMAVSVGLAMQKLAKYFRRAKPDIVLILGDRGEMLAAAAAADYLNIPVAHIHGGEISGHVDGILRHAITKLSHLHFAATEEAKDRILSLGEEPWRVVVSGAPALDRILNEKLPDSKAVYRRYGLEYGKKTVIIIQHPVSTEVKNAPIQIRETLAAVKSFGLQTVVIYPNADAGGRKMIQEIEKYRKFPDLHLFKSVPQRDYFALLKEAALLVGNSSSGIIETPSFKIPVVNIGSRQAGRLKCANVIDTDYSRDSIARAIKKALRDKNFVLKVKRCKNPYGDGHAAERVVKVLSQVKLDEKLLLKKITY